MERKKNSGDLKKNMNSESKFTEKKGRDATEAVKQEIFFN